MATDWNRIMQLVVLVVMCTIYTVVSMLRFAYDMLTKGKIVMLNRVVHQPAPVLNAKEWNHDYVKLSTLKLHYVHMGDRKKPLMLFVHGFPEFWYSWRHQLREFSKDYWCVAIDMRGYNLSDKPNGIDAYSISYLAQDVREVVEALGRRSCVLVGHDWGALVSWTTALMYPDVVDKLIIMNCPHPVAFKAHLQSSLKQFLKSWYIFWFQCPYWPEFMLSSQDCHTIEQAFSKGPKNKTAFTASDIEAWKHVYSQPGAWTAPLNYYRAAFQLPPDPKMPTNKIKPPTMIIWGTNDKALDMIMAEKSVLLCENAQLRHVEGASHWVQNDSPKECHAFMWEFLRK